LQKNAFLQGLKAQNWVLYYAVLTKGLKELMPVIYTPTEVRSLFFVSA
jgi:malate dehydrogenase (oxaloacetate-decarboxylating)